jgi:fucose permease
MTVCQKQVMILFIAMGGGAVMPLMQRLVEETYEREDEMTHRKGR